MKKSILLSLSAALLFSGAAYAGPTVGIARQAKIVVGDLNLNSEAGIAVLFERLRVATASVCGQAPLAGAANEDFERASYKSCKDGAWTDAIAKLEGKVPASVLTAAK